MQNFNDLIKAEKRHQVFLGLVFVIYILINIQTPESLAGLIDNVYGNIAVILGAFYLLAHCNPIIGIVGLYAAYELIKRSSHSTGTLAIQRYLPTELKKTGHLSAFNQFPVTLEEEMVKQMAPLVSENGPAHLHYKPASDDTHNAMDVHDTTSVI